MKDRLLASSEAIRTEVVKDAYQRGLRVKNLESQPAPWVVKGLRKFEQHRELTQGDIIRFDKIA